MSAEQANAVDGFDGRSHAATSHAATGGGDAGRGQLLTVQEVAHLLHVPTSWVYERTRRRSGDQLPHVKLGKYLRFEEATITDFIQRQRCA
jgi:excisionase family DNA binding protein